MARSSDSSRVVYVYGASSLEETTKKKGVPRIRRLVGSALLALLTLVAARVISPSKFEMLLSKLPGVRKVRAASAPADTAPLPAVPVAWSELDLSAMSADVAQDLESGKYYYDNRYPGNFGLAISYWEQALAHTGESDRDGVQSLITSARQELAAQFARDSGDAIVLLKQRKKDLVVVLLEKMRADFPDITAPQYHWASVTLSRCRR
jgi:hypothetical protein